jgi:hypothetical protein
MAICSAVQSYCSTQRGLVGDEHLEWRLRQRAGQHDKEVLVFDYVLDRPKECLIGTKKPIQSVIIHCNPLRHCLREVRMARLIEFKLPGGGSLVAEVEDEPRAGPHPAGAGGGAIEKATVGLDQAIAKVRPFAELLLAQLKELSREPDQVSVEFGIKLNVEAGAIIAKTGVEGNCKVTVSWKKVSDAKS